MTKIFYFSATGNSLYVAQVLQKNLNGAEIFSPKTRRRKLLALAMGRKAAHYSFLFDFFIEKRRKTPSFSYGDISRKY